MSYRLRCPRIASRPPAINANALSPEVGSGSNNDFSSEVDGGACGSLAAYGSHPSTFNPQELHGAARAEGTKDIDRIQQSSRLDFSTKFVGLWNTDQELQLDSVAVSIQPPCLIKMDVDGAEENILKGAQRLNRLSGVRWLIETHSKEL
jgi:hypothetical protein